MPLQFCHPEAPHKKLRISTANMTSRISRATAMTAKPSISTATCRAP